MVIEPIILLFLSFNVLMISLGIPCSFFPKLVPKICLEVFLYGKNSDSFSQSKFVNVIQVPKRWFTHFYIFGTIYSVFAFAVLFCYVFLGWDLATSSLLGYISLFSPNLNCLVADPTVGLFAALLFSVHMGRRLYETMFLNKFSNAKMNLVHYLSGVLHYTGAITSLLVYSVDQAKVVKRESSYPNISQIYNITTAVGTFLFTIASYFQFKSNLILVELRRGNNMEKYSLPMGGLFNFVSCPHYFCEILIYLSFSIILGVNHYVWGLITSWVILNQVLSGWTSHQWYLKNLKNYPRRRKAVIPYIL